MLNRCPSCQASVLDDDAEVCPFCGSPMDPAKAKGFKSAAKAAPTSPAKTATPAAPAAKSAAAAKPTATTAKKAAPPAPEDPFASDAAATAGAIPLGRRPSTQRPHKVVCPMCDTPGYAPEAASGKQVRCAKPDCLVPVFTAPDFAAPKAPEPEPSSSLGPTLLTFGAVAAILLVGVAVWWFVLREPAPRTSAPAVANGPIVPPQPDTPAETDPATTEPAEPTPSGPTPAESLATVLARWPQVTEDITQAQRQPLNRRFAAEAYAIAGRPDAAREQLAKIDALRSGDPFYKITPLAELAWLHLSQGDQAAAQAAFDELAPLNARIPQQGFDPARVAIGWSAAAARFGQDQQARDVARAPRDDAAGENLLAMLRAASLFSGGDLNAEHSLRPVSSWSEAKATAATLELLNQRQLDAARNWANGSPDPLAHAENLAAWAEATAIDRAVAADERTAAITDALSSSDPAERAYVLARTALRLASRGEKDPAQSLLTAAVEAAAQFPQPEPFAVADLAELSRRDLPDQSIARLRAAALSEATHAAVRLGSSGQAGTLLAQALDHLRSAAPSPAAAAERQQEFDKLGISGVQRELKTLLNLGSDDQARNAANAYRRKLEDVRSAAASRFNFQTELLARAVGWKLGPNVLAEAKEHHDASDLNAREPYLAGAPGGRLLAAAETAGDAETAKQLRAAGVANRDVPATEALALTIGLSLAKGDAEAAGRELESNNWRRVGRSEKLALAIRTACRLTKEKSASDAYAFVSALRDDAAREDALRYLSVYAARAGHAAAVEQQLPKLRLSPAEHAAVLRGLTEGLVAAGATAAPATESPAVPSGS